MRRLRLCRSRAGARRQVLSVLCSLPLPPPTVPLTLAHEWKEEPHLTDSPAFFCFTLLSFFFHHSPQKAGHLPWRDADFPGKPDGEVPQGREQDSASAGGPGAHPEASIQLSSMALLHPQSAVQTSISGMGPRRHCFLHSVSSGRGLEPTQSATH